LNVELSVIEVAMEIDIMLYTLQPSPQSKGKKVKEADLYSAFIEVPYTQGAQVRCRTLAERSKLHSSHFEKNAKNVVGFSSLVRLQG